MADKTTSWNGSVDGDWERDANWSNDAPNTDSSNDTLIFPSNAIRPPTINLDRSGDNTSTGLEPELVYIQSGANYGVGQFGNELTMRAKKVLHRGNGTLHYKSGGTSGNDTLDVTINSRNTEDAAVLTTNGVSRFVRIGVGGGSVVIALGVTTLDQLHVVGDDPTASVVLSAGSGKVVLLTQDGGTIESNLDVAPLPPGGGMAIIRNGLLILNGPAYQMTLQVAGGEVAYNVIGPPVGGIVETLHAIAGTTDLLALDGREMQVSTLFQFPGASVIRDAAGDIVNVLHNRTFGLDTE